MTMLRRRALLPAAISCLATPALAQSAPPHEWLFGSWTGGIFPAIDTEGPACFGTPVLIFTRDVVLRAASLDVIYRQRLIETVVPTPEGLMIRLLPAPGGRAGSEMGFGCGDDPDLLRIARIDADEIELPDCLDFPARLRRCRTP